MKFILCSDCFTNNGLRIEAAKFGIRSGASCPTCGSQSDRKLTRNNLHKLTSRFFVTGTIPHGVGGYAPILNYNPERAQDEVELDHDIERDWALIKSVIGGSLFYYGPPLWRIGITEHYDEPNVVSDQTITEIVQKLSVKTLPRGTRTFRIRKNIDSAEVQNSTQFGLPPVEAKRDYGRFDSREHEILCTSPSLPVCIHECRIIITDDVYVATFEAHTDLNLADLTTNYKQEPTSPLNRAGFAGGPNS
jgi:hypothetical protein